jgi:hypothetical protein
MNTSLDKHVLTSAEQCNAKLGTQHRCNCVRCRKVVSYIDQTPRLNDLQDVSHVKPPVPELRPLQLHPDPPVAHSVCRIGYLNNGRPSSRSEKAVLVLIGMVVAK